MNTLSPACSSLDALTEQLISIRGQLDPAKRLMVALAGAPGSGKSTLAEQLVERLDHAIVVPMDGFHLDNAVIEPRGDRPVKGAPHTFDVDGLLSLIQRLNDPQRPPVYVPVFDRSMDLARNAASLVEPSHDVLVVEGNYLLLNRPGWQALHRQFDVTVMLEVPLETLKERLVQRWIGHGHELNQALEKASSNDIPNALTVLQESVDADLRYESVRQ